MFRIKKRELHLLYLIFLKFSVNYEISILAENTDVISII